MMLKSVSRISVAKLIRRIRMADDGLSADGITTVKHQTLSRRQDQLISSFITITTSFSLTDLDTSQFINSRTESDDSIKYSKLPGSINIKNLHYQEKRAQFDTLLLISPIIRLASLNLKNLSSRQS